MKRLEVVAVVMLLTLTAGCGSSYEEYEKTVMKFGKNGSVSEEIQEAFDETIYDKNDLKTSIEEELTDYNEDFDEERIRLNKCKVRKGEAVVGLAYDSAEDYAKFNHADVFQGTISEFSQSEYHAYVDLKDAEGAVTSISSLAASGTDYSVVVLDRDCIAEIKGEICYFSDGVELISSKAANVTVSDEAYAYIVYK